MALPADDLADNHTMKLETAANLLFLKIQLFDPAQIKYRRITTIFQYYIPLCRRRLLQASWYVPPQSIRRRRLFIAFFQTFSTSFNCCGLPTHSKCMIKYAWSWNGNDFAF